MFSCLNKDINGGTDWFKWSKIPIKVFPIPMRIKEVFIGACKISGMIGGGRLGNGVIGMYIAYRLPV